MIRRIVRILSIAFILFVSLFALDTFGEEKWFLALMMHLIPSFVLIILTMVSWKKEFLGGVLWIITAILVSQTTDIGRIITIPMIIIGGLNFLAAKKKKLV